VEGPSPTRITPADAAPAAHVLAEAFASDPYLAWAFAAAPDRAAALDEFFRWVVDDALPHGQVLACGHEAVAVWLPPDEGSAVPSGAVEPYAELVSRLAGAERVGRMLEASAAMRALRPEGPHWYLSAVGTVGAARGTGAGRALVAAGIDRAAAAGLPVHLESTNPANAGYYERLGFASVGRVDAAPDLAVTAYRLAPVAAG
jgi:ribosomal protein S18 acetylase RimI-like enzyme